MTSRSHLVRAISLFCLLFIGCEKAPSPSSSVGGTGPSDSSSLYDQIVAKVQAVRSPDREYYRVIIRNGGDAEIVVRGLVLQQWSELNSAEYPQRWLEDSNQRIWEEEPHGHTHTFPELARGETYELPGLPRKNKGVVLRFGLAVRPKNQEIPRWLIVWSNGVNPERDWPAEKEIPRLSN